MVTALRRTRGDGHNTVAIPVLGLLAALAWVTLLAWGRSPWRGYLDHDGLEHPDVWRELLMVAGWTVMVTAMMLPASLPVVGLFRRLVAGRDRPGRLVAVVVAAYLGVWTAVGIAALAGDAVLHAVVDATPWLARRPELVLAATLAGAGVYQFSGLKYRCLDKCRLPYNVVVSSWQGGDDRAAALRLGLRHGAFCVGCCIATMLVMLALGMGNPGWMLVLGTEMGLERNVAWGRRLGHPTGVVLLGAAALVALRAV